MLIYKKEAFKLATDSDEEESEIRTNVIMNANESKASDGNKEEEECKQKCF